MSLNWIVSVIQGKGAKHAIATFNCSTEYVNLDLKVFLISCCLATFNQRKIHCFCFNWRRLYLKGWKRLEKNVSLQRYFYFSFPKQVSLVSTHYDTRLFHQMTFFRLFSSNIFLHLWSRKWKFCNNLWPSLPMLSLKKVSRFLFCHEKKIYLTHCAFKWANPVLYFFIFVFSKFELTHKYNQTFFWWIWDSNHRSDSLTYCATNTARLVVFY